MVVQIQAPTRLRTKMEHHPRTRRAQLATIRAGQALNLGRRHPIWIARCFAEDLLAAPMVWEDTKNRQTAS